MSAKIKDAYGILCESEEGVDIFKKPIGEMILLESVGEMLTREEAYKRARELAESERMGKVAVVRLVVDEFVL